MPTFRKHFSTLQYLSSTTNFDVITQIITSDTHKMQCVCACVAITNYYLPFTPPANSVPNHAPFRLRSVKYNVYNCFIKCPQSYYINKKEQRINTKLLVKLQRTANGTFSLSQEVSLEGHGVTHSRKSNFRDAPRHDWLAWCGV